MVESNLSLDEWLNYFESRLTLDRETLARIIKNVDINKDAKSNLIKEIVQSGTLDLELYLKQNKDVRDSGIGPLEHYLNHGYKEQRILKPMQESNLINAQSYENSAAYTPILNKNHYLYNKYHPAVDIVVRWISPYLDLSTAKIIDFGCGNGEMAVSMAYRYPHAEVFGVDIGATAEKCLSCGITELGIKQLPQNLTFINIKPGEKFLIDYRFDFIYSWSVYEHINQNILNEALLHLKNILKPNAYLFTQISPLYYSRYGSHLSEWIPLPWAHLWLEEDNLYSWLSDKCSNKRTRDSAWGTYTSLNKITAKSLAQMLNALPLECVKTYIQTSEKRISFPDVIPEESLNKEILIDYPYTQLCQIYNPVVLLTEQLVYLYRKLPF